jgi:hypothetical protein
LERFYVRGEICEFESSQTFREALQSQGIKIHGDFLFDSEGISCFGIEDKPEEYRDFRAGMHLIWEEDLGGSQEEIQANYLKSLSPETIASLEIPRPVPKQETLRSLISTNVESNSEISGIRQSEV